MTFCSPSEADQPVPKISGPLPHPPNLRENAVLNRAWDLTSLVATAGPICCHPEIGSVYFLWSNLTPKEDRKYDGEEPSQ
jgi:hypothetical protein